MKSHGQMKEGHYRHLFMMAAMSFAAMYALMYAMLASAGDLYNNVNQVYMAGLMTAPMVLIEMFVMAAMFPNRKLNAQIAGASVAVGIACFAMIREQTAVSDEQFLRSMIPHHSSAILMCTEAPIRSVEIKDLCKAITTSQRREIDQMRALLNGEKAAASGR